MSSKDILITGASGGIGNEILNSIIFGNNKVIAIANRQPIEITTRYYNGESTFCENIDFTFLDNDEKDHIRKIFENINTVIHCAGIASTNKPFEALETNILGMYNLLEVLPNINTFINISSITISNSSNSKPISEYSLSKQTAEELLRIANLRNKIKRVVNLRCCATTGIKTQHGLLVDLIKKLKSDSEELELFGNAPGSIKPFLHIKDLCNIITDILKDKTNRNGVETYNIANTSSISVEEIAYIAQKIMSIQKPLKWLGEKSLWAGDNKLLIGNYNYDRYNLEFSSTEAVRLGILKLLL